MVSKAISDSVSPSRPRFTAILVMRMVIALLSFSGSMKSAIASSSSSGGAETLARPHSSPRGREQLAREQQFLGLAQADVARQAIDRAGAAEERAADVEVADPGVVGGDAEIARDHQLEAARDRITLNGRDRRLPQVERTVVGPG